MTKEFSIKDLQKVKTSEIISLFEYVGEVSKVIGRGTALEILENIITRERLNWFNKNRDKLNFSDSSIDQVYRIFYQDYLKLTPKDVEIVEKTENKLITRWRNFCPVLEACKSLGLDTKEICKKCYERPVQAFISQINPKLKFRRNYDRIRPHADFCEEIIELSD